MIRWRPEATGQHMSLDLSLIHISMCIRDRRKAIAEYLKSFRGMLVDANQIVMGAGTEYLYGMLVQLLGNDREYCIENPGYKKLVQIYQQHQICLLYTSKDDGKGDTGKEDTGKDDGKGDTGKDDTGKDDGKEDEAFTGLKEIDGIWWYLTEGDVLSLIHI